MQTYLEGRVVAAPLTVHDCCLLSDGGRAFIVTSSDRAKGLRKPPVYLEGWGEQTLAGTILGPDSALVSPAKEAARIALAQAQISVQDIDVFEVYDCFTPAVIVTLEDYGLCPKGEGGPFVADGKLGPGGSLPFNTSGGLLAEVYLHNWTQVTEAVLQVRGECGPRQTPDCETALVGANGGTFQHHVALVLAR
jgi:acetyl-CoA acetyltransferase